MMVLRAFLFAAVTIECARIGIEIETKTMTRSKNPNMQFRKGTELYTTPDWVIQTDDVILGGEAGFVFEFITRPFDIGSELDTLTEALDNIHQLYANLMTLHWRSFPDMIDRDSLFDQKEHHFLSEEERLTACVCRSDLFHQAGHGLTLMAEMVPNLNYDITYWVFEPTAFAQITFGARPDNLLLVLGHLYKTLSGSLLAHPSQPYHEYLAHTLAVLDSNQIRHPETRTFVFMVASYILAGQECSRLQRLNKPFPFPKMFTQNAGFLARNSYDKMFHALSVDQQEFLRQNMISILQQITERACDGSGSILESPFFRNGYEWDGVRKEGPMIMDWVKGFMFEGVDHLSGGDFESMGAMDFDGDLWLIELRTTTELILAIPDWDDIEVMGFGNLKSFIGVLAELLSLDYKSLVTLDSRAFISQWHSNRILGYFDSLPLQRALDRCETRLDRNEFLVDHS